MDPQALWLVALSIATPVAGVVGFAIQLRQVRKARLENEKLQLEIAALKAKAAASEKRIIQATNIEVERFAGRDTKFSTYKGGDMPTRKLARKSLKEIATNATIILAFFLMISYFLYDLYRLGAWISSKL